MWGSAALLNLVAMTETLLDLAHSSTAGPGSNPSPPRGPWAKEWRTSQWRSWEATPSVAAFRHERQSRRGSAWPASDLFLHRPSVARGLCLGPLFAPTYCPGSHWPRRHHGGRGLLDGQTAGGAVPRGQVDALAGLTTFTVTLLVGPERGILAGGRRRPALCYLWRTWRMPRVEKQAEAPMKPTRTNS